MRKVLSVVPYGHPASSAKLKSFNSFLSRSDYPERELRRINHSKTALIRLPTHVGCAFAVDRDFFYEIGSYDEGMDIWGSENLDLALRVGIFVLIFLYPSFFCQFLLVFIGVNLVFFYILNFTDQCSCC